MSTPHDHESDAAARVDARHANDRVLDAPALRALAHPLRVKIYDILSQYGPQTASSLAERLGESTGSTSYHLRALAKQDLIRERPGQGTGRERWWERPVGGVSMSAAGTAKTPAARAVTQLVTSEFFRLRQQALLEFHDHAIGLEDDEWKHASLISTATARLTPAQSAELTHRLMAIIDETVDRYRNQQGEDVRPVTIRADVFPLPDIGGVS